MARRLLRSLAFPSPTDPRALAERVGAEFRAYAIVGTSIDYEVTFVEPASLILVISRDQARIFVDGRHDEEIDETAEDIEHFIAVALGMVVDDDGPDDEPARDPSDQRAAAFVEALLADGLLELVTPRSRAQVEGKVAHLLAHGKASPAELGAALTDSRGVSELYADDAQLAAVLARIAAGHK